jgi:hypothetical protein
VDVNWKADLDIVLAIKGKFAAGLTTTLNVAITNFEFAGSFRLTLNPLFNVLPIVGRCSVTMVKTPYINYQVRYTWPGVFVRARTGGVLQCHSVTVRGIMVPAV